MKGVYMILQFLCLDRSKQQTQTHKRKHIRATIAIICSIYNLYIGSNFSLNSCGLHLRAFAVLDDYSGPNRK